MYYNMQDFEEMAELANEIRRYYPQQPELAMRHFEQSYTRLISGLVLGMAWNYLEAEHILYTGERTHPLEATRKWESSDFAHYTKHHRN